MAGPGALLRRHPRRWLLRRGAIGVGLGTVWAAGLHAMGLPDAPSLSIVGEKGSQIVLLDTTGARALILLGEPSDRLVEQIPSLMTALRQRIDIVIGADAVLAGSAAGIGERWHARHQLVVPDRLGGTHPPDTAERTTVRSALSLDLGTGIRASIHISARGEWRAGDEGEGAAWAVLIAHGASRIALAPTAAGALVAGPNRPSLIVTPGDDIALIEEKLSPGAVAVNADALAPDKEASGFALLRTFPDDVARVELRADGVRLPGWAQPGTAGDG